MPARRCNTHGNWRAEPKFHQCPECGEKTDWISNGNPMSDSEINHRLFEVFCRKRDEKLDAQLKDFEAALDAAPTIPDPSGAEDLPPALPNQRLQPDGTMLPYEKPKGE